MISLKDQVFIDPKRATPRDDRSDLDSGMGRKRKWRGRMSIEGGFGLDADVAPV